MLWRSHPPNLSPSSSKTHLSSSACSNVALASTLALVPPYQAGVSLVLEALGQVVNLLGYPLEDSGIIMGLVVKVCEVLAVHVPSTSGVGSGGRGA